MVQVADDVAASPDDGGLGGHGSVGLDAQIEGGEERVRGPVGGEENVLVGQEARGEEVAHGVVFFVEVEDCSVRGAW